MKEHSKRDGIRDVDFYMLVPTEDAAFMRETCLAYAPRQSRLLFAVKKGLVGEELATGEAGHAKVSQYTRQNQSGRNFGNRPSVQE